jgi:hypothetical protein
MSEHADDIDLGEWDIICSDYASHEDDSDRPELVTRVGNTMEIWAGAAPKSIKGDSVDKIRRDLTAKIRDIVFSSDAGAWLLRHAPGVGKTHTFGMVANEYESLGQPVVMCAPTIAEAERLATAAGTWTLKAQSPTNCRQMQIEQDAPANLRPLTNHHRGRHRGSDYCRSCPYQQECLGTKGQYRHDQKQFHMAVAAGTIYCATTVAMLEYVAAAINESKHRVVIWTDEDLMPHVAKPAPPVSRAEILEWIAHAQRVSAGHADDIAFMAAVDAELARNAEGESPETPDDHSTGPGCRAMAIRADYLPGMRAMAECVLSRLGKSATHITEKTREDGEPLAVGFWRPATIRVCAELVLGACWVHLDAKDYRYLIGTTINRDLLTLPRKNALLQSDATASPDLWRRVWGQAWRGHLDCRPQRAASINWVVGSLGSKTGASSQQTQARLVNRLAAWKDANPGKRAGLITHKGWIEAVKKALRGKRVKVYEIDGDGDPKACDVVLGWYGRHDRGVNAYHEAGVSELFIVGSFRLPMSAYHQKAKALLEMGAEIPHTAKSRSARCGPTAINGEYLVQSANRATVAEHPQTCWIADHERAAALTQAIERIRSVDRAAKGMAPAVVHLWGIDATIPHVALPVSYSY